MEEKKMLTEEELKKVTGGAGGYTPPNSLEPCTNPQCSFYGQACHAFTETEGEYAGFHVCGACHIPIVPPCFNTLEEYVSAMKEILSLRQS